jgi:hypothetical protein
MAQDPKAKATSPAKLSTSQGALHEAEVYGALGALLGMLEVIATDDAAPVSPAQLARLRAALSHGQRLEQYVEALLTLSAEDLGQRLRLKRCALRPLLEHSLRGALRTFEAQAVTLRWPPAEHGRAEHVLIDASRVDRALSALVATLASSLGRGGAIAVSIACSDGRAVLGLRGEPGPEAPREPSAFDSGLLERACRRLLELHGRGFSLELQQASFELVMPLAEAP